MQALVRGERFCGEGLDGDRGVKALDRRMI
jgi:hypothetical protein